MGRIKRYLSLLMHLGLKMLVFEAVLLALSWLFHRYWILLQHLSFGDVLFFMGTLAAVIGAGGMLHSPYGVPLSPLGVWASQTQATEEERRVQQIEELVRQKSFAINMLAVGVITILLSIAIVHSN